MKHYRIEKGTHCEAKPPGSTRWEPHTLQKRLWFVAKREDSGMWVFEFSGWEFRVHPAMVGGAAAGWHRVPGQDEGRAVA